MKKERLEQQKKKVKISLLARAWQWAIALLVLLFVIAAIATSLYLLLSKPEPVLPEEAVMTHEVYQGYDLDSMGELVISQRPLFWQGRRPIEKQEEVESAPVVAKVNRAIDEFILVGLFDSGPDSSAVVIYKDKKQRIRVGETLEGWLLIDVEANQATFKGTFDESSPVEKIALYEPVLFQQQWSGSGSELNNQSGF